MKTGLFEDLGQHDVVGVDQVSVSRRAVVVRMLAGEKRGVRGQRGRYHGHGVGEEDRLFRERVDVGRLDLGVAVAAEVIGAGGVERDDDDVLDRAVVSVCEAEVIDAVGSRDDGDCAADKRERTRALRRLGGRACRWFLTNRFGVLFSAVFLGHSFSDVRSVCVSRTRSPALRGSDWVNPTSTYSSRGAGWFSTVGP